MMVAPSNPMTRKPDSSSWRTADYKEFDGVAEDCFRSTSLHLSFTDYHIPLYTGNRGVHDNQVSLIEAVVSVRDAGKWVTDLDIATIFPSEDAFSRRERRLVRHLDLQEHCSHDKSISLESIMVSVECWDELLDPPTGLFVVRAHKNWTARLAITTFLIQRRNETGISFPVTVCPESVCWSCVRQHFSSHAFIF
jgi:hypothetical protein